MVFVLVVAIVNVVAGVAVVGASESEGKPAAAANPFAAHALSPEEQFAFEGAVEERLEAGPYAYQRVAGRWVVSLAITTPREARRVRVTAVGHATHFSSPRLARTFDELVFGMVRSIP